MRRYVGNRVVLILLAGCYLIIKPIAPPFDHRFQKPILIAEAILHTALGDTRCLRDGIHSQRDDTAFCHNLFGHIQHMVAINRTRTASFLQFLTFHTSGFILCQPP